MSVVFTTVTVTPVAGGASITLPMPESIETDASGNVTFTFKDATSDLRAALASVLAGNVEQHRTRGATFIVIADSGAVQVDVAYAEVDAWTATTRAKTVRGAITAPASRFARAEDTLTLVAYRADSVFTRGGA